MSYCITGIAGFSVIPLFSTLLLFQSSKREEFFFSKKIIHSRFVPLHVVSFLTSYNKKKVKRRSRKVAYCGLDERYDYFHLLIIRTSSSSSRSDKQEKKSLAKCCGALVREYVIMRRCELWIIHGSVHYCGGWFGRGSSLLGLTYHTNSFMRYKIVWKINRMTTVIEKRLVRNGMVLISRWTLNSH